MKATRIIDATKVRNICIKYNFYTCGTSDEYDHLLIDLCGHGREVTDDGLESIARDIVAHSERKVFEDMTEDTRKASCIKVVTSILNNECCEMVSMENDCPATVLKETYSLIEELRAQGHLGALLLKNYVCRYICCVEDFRRLFHSGDYSSLCSKREKMYELLTFIEGFLWGIRTCEVVSVVRIDQCIDELISCIHFD